MMHGVLKKLGKNSLIYGVSSTIQRFLGLLLLPVYTKAFSPDDYGVISLVSIIGVAMNSLLTLGTGNSMGILYFEESNVTKRSDIIWSNAFLMLLNCGFWYFTFFIFSPILSQWMFETEKYSNLIRLSFLSTVLITLSDPFLAFMRMENHSRQYVKITIIGSVITIILSAYFVLWLNLGIVGLLLSGIVGSASVLVLSLVYFISRFNFRLNLRLISPLVRIGFPSIFGIFSFLLIDYADRQLIQKMSGLAALGVYSVGYSFGMVIMIAVSAFSIAWPPYFMSFINKIEEAKKIFPRILTYYFFGFGIAIVFFFLMSKPVLELMTSTSFHDAWRLVGLICASYALKGAYLIILPGLYFSKKIGRQSLIEWGAAIVNIIANFLLIPIYGLIGAAFATFLGYLTLPILARVASRKLLVIHYEWGRLTAVSILIIFASTGIYFIYQNVSFDLMQQVVYSLFVFIFYILIFYIFVLNKSERNFINNLYIEKR